MWWIFFFFHWVRHHCCPTVQHWERFFSLHSSLLVRSPILVFTQVRSLFGKLRHWNFPDILGPLGGNHPSGPTAVLRQLNTPLCYSQSRLDHCNEVMKTSNAGKRCDKHTHSKMMINTINAKCCILISYITANSAQKVALLLGWTAFIKII